MQEEIKEILDRLENYDNYKYRNDNGLSYKEIEGWEIDLLLDYITNLQEENEKLKQIIKAANMMEYFKGLDKDGSFNNI